MPTKATTATKPKTKSEQPDIEPPKTPPKKNGKKSNVSPFPTAKPTEAENAPANVSENAKIIFGIIAAEAAAENATGKTSFDSISDKSDFSFDEINNGLKELEEAGAIERLPELEYKLAGVKAAEDAGTGNAPETGEKSPQGAETGESGGNEEETGTDQTGEEESGAESFDILGAVDGGKLKEIAAKQAEEEAEKRTIKLPRPQRLPEMQESGAIAELEEKALSHEDCKHTEKVMKQKEETLRAEMLEIMKKHNLETYKHGGFVIKRQTQGETVKIVSVQQKDE